MTTPGSSANPLNWADRFRAAMLGGAVGDALGAAARDLSTADIQRWYGPHGLTEVRYEPLTFGIATLYVGVKPGDPAPVA